MVSQRVYSYKTTTCYKTIDTIYKTVKGNRLFFQKSRKSTIMQNDRVHNLRASLFISYLSYALVICSERSAMWFQHELVVELICKRLHRPPAWDGQNGPLPVRLLCWTPFAGRSRSDLPWAGPQRILVCSPWPLWVPAEVQACLTSVPIERKTKISHRPIIALKVSSWQIWQLEFTFRAKACNPEITWGREIGL